jgi:hypothetical protein
MMVVTDLALLLPHNEQAEVVVAQVALEVMQQILLEATEALAHHHQLLDRLLAEQAAVAVVVLQPQERQPTVALMEIQAGLDLMLMQTVVEVVVAQVALLM